MEARDPALAALERDPFSKAHQGSPDFDQLREPPTLHESEINPARMLVLGFTHPDTEQGLRCSAIAREALDAFFRKNNGYGDPNGDDLGVAGQFSDMNRKWKLLRGYMWDGKPWTHVETFEEVLFDMIGHILLTVDRNREGKMR